MESQEEKKYRRERMIIVLTAIILLSPVIPAGGISSQEDVGNLSLDGIYWPMLGRDVFNSHAGITGERGLQDPYLKWSDPDNSTATGAVGSDMTDNIEFSGIAKRDIRFLVDSNRTTVFVRDGTTGEIAWSADVRDVEDRVTSSLFTSPSLVDTDSDGRVEICTVISDGSTHQVALFEPNITLTASGYSLDSDPAKDDLVWISIFGPQGTSRSSSPLIHDITGDGVEDIVFGAGNRLYAYHGTNGTIIWYLDVGSIGDTLSTPALYPGTGSIKRLVVNSLSVNRRTLRTTVVNLNGDHLKNVTEDLTPALIQYPYPGTIVPMPVVSDLAGDGTPFIIVPVPAISNYGRLKIYSYSLDLAAEIDDIIGAYDGFLAVADVGGSPGEEIFLQSRRSGFPGTLVAYEVFDDGSGYDSRRLWTRESLSTTPTQYAPPMTCDLDEDGIPDAVFFNNGLYSAILSDGTHYWNLTVPDGAPSGSGLIGDLNMDGFVDMYLDGYLYSQKLIDLKVKEPHITNIYLDNIEPVDGTPVTVNCIVENTWGTDVDDVVVRFIDIFEGSDPLLIGYDTISLTDTAEASVEWVPEGDGDHTITVLIDPDGNITETDEGNNQGDATFSVTPAFPDLTISGIHFMRGDGEIIEEKHLVENDPSWIVVTVENIGQRSTTGGEIRVNVNGGPPSGGDEFTDLDPIERSASVNITLPWTPSGIPQDQPGEEFIIDAWVSVPQGKSELTIDNNHLSNTTTVKNRTPVQPLFIQGLITDPRGEPEDGVKVTLELPRTGDTLGPITSSNGGEYGFDMNFIDYLDGDTATIRGSKDMMWGENSTKLYSEDTLQEVDINLTDVPTLSLFISPDGETERKVDPGETVSVSFTVENNGNIQGDVTVTKEIGGNSTLLSTDMDIEPSTFTLGPGSSKKVDLTYTVPGDERPNTLISTQITCTISGNGTFSRQIFYQHSVRGKERAQVQMISPNNITLGPGSSNEVSFEFYLYNSGNIPLSYQVSTSSSLEDDVEFQDGSGNLDPQDSASPFVYVTLPNASDSLTGRIFISTSGLGTVGDFLIDIERATPDIRVKGVIGSDPADPVLGNEIGLFATIDNSGEVAVSSVKCSFFEGDILIGTRIVENNLLPGEQTTITGITWTPEGIGDHTVTFKIDPDNDINEIMETDNSADRTFNFYPDLSVRSFSIDGRSPSAGETVEAIISVENEGNAPLTRGFRVTLTVDSLSGEQLISDTFDSLLDPERDPSETIRLSFEVPPGSGNRSIHVVVEPEGQDAELDTLDNSASFEIDVAKEEDDGPLTGLLPLIIGGAVLLLVAGIGVYVWRFGLPSAPPPDEEETMDVPEDEEEIRVESMEDEDEDIPMMDMEPPEKDPEVLEMRIEPEKTDVDEGGAPLVAEVIEMEDIEENEPLPDEDEDGEEPLVPEV